MSRIGTIAAVMVILFGVMPSSVAMADEKEQAKPFLEDGPLEISADTAVYSKYIWRGFKLDGDPVMQPGAYASAYGFQASVWGSFDIDNNDSLDSDEVDYSAGYTFDMKKYINMPVSISGGYTYYDFIGTKLNSQEVYAGLSFDIILSPAITWYHDFEKEEKGGGHGDYILAEISHSLPIGNYPVTLDLSAHAGYNHKLFIRGDGGDIGLNAGLTFKLSKNCNLSPNAGYSIPFGDLKSSDDGNQDNEFYGGIKITFNS